MFHCFMFFPCVVSWCGFSKGFLSNQCATQPLSPVGHSQGLRLKWYDQLARSWTEPNPCRAFRWIRQIWGNEWAPWKSSCFLPRFLRTLLARFGTWFHDPQPASISRLLRAASNFHEQKLHKTYPPFPKRFLLCSQVSLCRVPVAFQIVDSQVAEPT